MDANGFWCCMLLVHTVFIPHILSGILRFSADGQASVMTILDRFLQTTAVKEENLLKEKLYCPAFHPWNQVGISITQTKFTKE